jgi:hypothetical protein
MEELRDFEDTNKYAGDRRTCRTWLKIEELCFPFVKAFLKKNMKAFLLKKPVSQLVIHLLAFRNILTGTVGVQTRCTSAEVPLEYSESLNVHPLCFQ